LMKEYFPADFAKLKQFVDEGRWFPAGSSMEEGDVNAPSAESIIRQILYGNNWFRKEFGKASAEYMLPDCFGFPSSLPTILAHSGVKGFSTQKLVWGSSANAGGPESLEKTPEGTPFNVGVWAGPDGESVLAGLNPGAYDGGIDTETVESIPGDYRQFYIRLREAITKGAPPPAMPTEAWRTARVLEWAVQSSAERREIECDFSKEPVL